MRIRYLVSYDISDAKRWRKVFRTLRGYGDHLHYSVFRCDLSGCERILLLEALTAVIHHKEDRVMLVRLGPASGRAQESIESLGRPTESGPIGRLAVVV